MTHGMLHVVLRQGSGACLDQMMPSSAINWRGTNDDYDEDGFELRQLNKAVQLCYVSLRCVSQRELKLFELCFPRLTTLFSTRPHPICIICCYPRSTSSNRNKLLLQIIHFTTYHSFTYLYMDHFCSFILLVHSNQSHSESPGVSLSVWLPLLSYPDIHCSITLSFHAL